MSDPAKVAFSERNYEAALVLFRAGAAGAVLHSNSAACLLELGRYAEAVKECDVALSMKPDSSLREKIEARRERALGLSKLALPAERPASAPGDLRGAARSTFPFYPSSHGEPQPGLARMEVRPDLNLRSNLTEEVKRDAAAGAVLAAEAVDLSEKREYVVCHMGVGDPRNVLATLAHFAVSKPHPEATLKVVMNDINPHNVVRNLAILSCLGDEGLPAGDRAAFAVALWGSWRIPPGAMRWLRGFMSSITASAGPDPLLIALGVRAADLVTALNLRVAAKNILEKSASGAVLEPVCPSFKDVVESERQALAMIGEELPVSAHNLQAEARAVQMEEMALVLNKETFEMFKTMLTPDKPESKTFDTSSMEAFREDLKRAASKIRAENQGPASRSAAGVRSGVQQLMVDECSSLMIAAKATVDTLMATMTFPLPADCSDRGCRPSDWVPNPLLFDCSARGKDLRPVDNSMTPISACKVMQWICNMLPNAPSLAGTAVGLTLLEPASLPRLCVDTLAGCFPAIHGRHALVLSCGDMLQFASSEAGCALRGRVDRVDTTNVMDYVGLLPMWMAFAPLLRPRTGNLVVVCLACPTLYSGGKDHLEKSLCGHQVSPRFFGLAESRGSVWGGLAYRRLGPDEERELARPADREGIVAWLRELLDLVVFPPTLGAGSHIIEAHPMAPACWFSAVLHLASRYPLHWFGEVVSEVHLAPVWRFSFASRNEVTGEMVYPPSVATRNLTLVPHRDELFALADAFDCRDWLPLDPKIPVFGHVHIGVPFKPSARVSQLTCKDDIGALSIILLPERDAKTFDVGDMVNPGPDGTIAAAEWIEHGRILRSLISHFRYKTKVAQTRQMAVVFSTATNAVLQEAVPVEILSKF